MESWQSKQAAALALSIKPLAFAFSARKVANLAATPQRASGNAAI
jgi:hypothetical protein